MTSSRRPERLAVVPGVFAAILMVLLESAGCSGDSEVRSGLPTPFVEEAHGGSGCLCGTPPDPRLIAVDPSRTERWGDFVLTADGQPSPGATPGSRADFPSNDQGPFAHPLAMIVRDEASARADLRIPMADVVPGGQELLMASVLVDGRGAAAAYTSYYQAGRKPSGGQDGTVLIGWTRIVGRPLEVPTRLVPRQGSSAVEEAVYKVVVRGFPGVLRLRGGASPDQLYVQRTPTVLLNWYDDEDVFWTVSAYYLTPTQAIDLAESIRPTITR